MSSHLPEQFRYDSIFVDEAQDFRPEWWPLVQAMLKPEGKLYLFEDTNQSIFGKERRSTPNLPTRIKLRCNMRNTFDIATFSSSLLPNTGDMAVLPVQGEHITVMGASDDPQERARLVEESIRAIYQAHHGQVRPCDIVVLSPWNTRKDRCALPYIKGVSAAPIGETPEQANARHARCRLWDSQEVLGDTIKSYKGLESPFVILTDIPALGESAGFGMNDFYVGCTRARFGLYIVPTSTGAAFVQECLAQSRHNGQPPA